MSWPVWRLVFKIEEFIMKKIIAILLSLMIFFGGIVAAQPAEDTSKKEDVPTFGELIDKGFIYMNNMLELGIKSSQKELEDFDKNEEKQKKSEKGTEKNYNDFFDNDNDFLSF